MLAADARAHRSRLIYQILSEVQDSGIEGKRDGWINAMEEVLDELGRIAVQRGWLNGIKRSRTARRQSKPNASVGDGELKAQDTSKDTIKAKLPQREATGHQPDSKVLPSPESTLHTREEQVASALKHIRDIVSQQTVNSSSANSDSLHLLLCVAALGSRTALPAEDSRLPLVPAKVGCVFTPCVFTLPEDGEDNVEAGNMLLYGLHEWDGKSCSEHHSSTLT